MRSIKTVSFIIFVKAKLESNLQYYPYMLCDSKRFLYVYLISM